MVTYEKAKVLLKRNPIIADTYDRIQRYTADNIYPQRCEELIMRAYTLNAVMNTKADFLNGEGFEDPNVANLRVNSKGLKGMTLNDVLNMVSAPMAKYKTIPLHIGYNLNGAISSITPVDYSFIRLGLPDNDGMITHLAYSTNWERDSRKGTRIDTEVIFFPIFDPRPEVVLEQMAEAGGINEYKGQIFYGDNLYQFASFEPVFDHAQTQADLGVFKVSNVQNAFMSTLAVVYSGDFESEQEKRDFKELIANKSGAKGAGSRIGIQDKSGTKKANEIFQTLTPPSIDRMYELTEKLVSEAIIENEAMPKVLVGVQPDSGLFNTEDMEKAYIYYNAKTRNARKIMSGVFSMLLEYWESPIVSDCKIIEQQYVIKTIAENDPKTINDNLKNLSGKQNIELKRILREFLKEVITYEQAKLKLQSGFGFTDEEVDIWLGIKEDGNTDNND